MTDKTGIDATELSFEGFDGNNEGRHYAYTLFVINDQGRWAESKKPDLNSHMPMLDRYRSMLKRWRQSADKHQLSKDDVVRIIARP